MEDTKKYKAKEAWVYAIHISIGNFINSYCFTELNSSINNVKATLQWEEGSICIPIAYSITILGYLFSNIAIISYSKRYGRRASMIIEHSINVVASILVVIPYTWTFLLGRLLKGVGSGGFFTICAPFINEIAPDELAGQLGSLVCISFVFGLAFTSGICLLLPSQDYSNDPQNLLWMVNLSIPGLISLYCLYYFLFVQQLDSPAWYLSNDRKNEAVQALSKVYTQAGIQTGLDRFEIKKTESLLKSKQPGYFAYIFSKKNRKIVRLAILLSIFKQFTAVNIILVYSTTIFQEISGDEFGARVISFVMMIVNIFSSLFGIVLLGWFGRKTLILFGQGTLACLLIVFAVFTLLDAGTMSLALTIFTYIFIASPTIGSAYWAFLGETMNDIAISLVSFTTTLVTFFFLFVFDWTVQTFSLPAVFLSLAAGSFIGALYIMFDVFETKGKKKAEIEICLFE